MYDFWAFDDVKGIFVVGEVGGVSSRLDSELEEELLMSMILHATLTTNFVSSRSDSELEELLMSMILPATLTTKLPALCPSLLSVLLLVLFV